MVVVGVGHGAQWSGWGMPSPSNHEWELSTHLVSSPPHTKGLELGVVGLSQGMARHKGWVWHLSPPIGTKVWEEGPVLVQGGGCVGAPLVVPWVFLGWSCPPMDGWYVR